MIKFSQLVARLKYPYKHKAVLSSYHSDIVNWVINNPVSQLSQKRYIIHCINCLTYAVLNGDYLPDKLPSHDPLSAIPQTDSFVVSDYLRATDLFLDLSDIEWDIDEISRVRVDPLVLARDEQSEDTVDDSNYKESNEVISDDVTTHEVIADEHSDNSNNKIKADSKKVDSCEYESNFILPKYETKKEDLYIQSPVVPRFDYTNPFLFLKDDGDTFAIYNTLPVIPEKQRDISVTTNINMMSDSDVVKLFPTKVMQTRASIMYDENIAHQYDLEIDDTLGIIFPISNYTREDIIRNLIRYPHIYQLKKEVDGKLVNFYSTIEIDGSLDKISEIWKNLKDADNLPKNKEFMKEYVVRRYLLEEEVSGMKHKYPIWCGLDPFLTLFMPAEKYAAFGYKDAVGIAKNCVSARINYKRRRNPILRRFGYV